MYINKESNHPEYIKKELPNMIQARLSAISSNEKVFKEAVGNYQQALINSGYKEKLEFHLTRSIFYMTSVVMIKQLLHKYGTTTML